MGDIFILLDAEGYPSKMCSYVFFFLLLFV